MDKVEKMHISEILDMTNLFITSDTLLEIWKDSTQGSNTLEGESVLDIFEQNPDLITELLNNDLEMYTFLVEHDEEIDKPRFLMTILLNYKERLAMAGSIKLDEEEMKNIQFGIKGIRTLLKGMDKTFVFYNAGDDEKITHLTVINSKEELAGIDRKKKNSNIRRLRELQQDTHLGNLIQALWLSDIEYVIPFEKEIGYSLRYVIEYNSMLDGTLKLPQETETEEDRVTFIAEMTRILETHIEEVNIDKLLLCSAYRYMKELENNNIKPEEIDILKARLDLIRKHIIKNIKIEVPPGEIYTIKDFERDLKRFVGKEEITYISKQKEQQIINSLLSGETTLYDIGAENINAIFIDSAELSQIVRNNPNNYIFFLNQEKCAYNKSVIMRDILNTKICSQELLQVLCEKTDITSEEICDLFDKEIISVSDLKSVREQTATIITNSKLFEQYKKYKQQVEEGQDIDVARAQLERYALAYRNTEILGKEEGEAQEKAEEFITEVGDEIDSPDIMLLYKFNIIPLKVSVEWGGEEIIEQLLESESLKPADAKYLKNEGLLDEKVVERIFEKCGQMSYAYQVSLVYAIFDGQTPEEQEIRERLAQHYHIENGITNSTGNGHTGKRRNFNNSHEEEPERKIKMRDPGAKYNLLASIDKDVKIEEGIIDGHIIFHYPNVGDGTVLIEKLHKITSNKNTGLIEIRPDNQSATYVLSEEEFIKIKSQLIQDGKVDRTELTQRWWITRDPEHWIPHTGTRGWEQALKERFLLDAENQRYTQADLVRIEQLLEKSIESKREER